MKPKLQENPREWRKAACFGALGFAGLSSVLRWRHVLSTAAWVCILAFLGLAVVAAFLKPRLFRGYYRFSQRLSSGLTEVIGRVALAAVFILVVTPLGVAMRLAGNDPLRQRQAVKATTYWRPAPPQTPLDRLF